MPCLVRLPPRPVTVPYKTLSIASLLPRISVLLPRSTVLPRAMSSEASVTAELAAPGAFWSAAVSCHR